MDERKDRVIVEVMGERPAYTGNEVAAAVSEYRKAVSGGKCVRIQIAGTTFLSHGPWPKVFLA